MIRVLVTGASGFLGGAVWRRLSERDNVETRASARADLVDEASVNAALAAWKPDVVVHAAGRTGGAADELRAGNIVLTRLVAEGLAAVCPNTRLILLGSAAQYGPSPDQVPWREDAACNPFDDYGASKLEAERAAFQSGAKVTSLRIFNVVSPAPHGGQVFSTFLRKAADAFSDRHPWQVDLGPLDAVRDFVTLDDVATVVERAVDRDVGGPLNVCSGHGRTVGDLVHGVLNALPGGAVGASAGSAPGVAWSVGDPSRCQALLGFTPSSDLSGLSSQAAAWVRAQASAGAHA